MQSIRALVGPGPPELWRLWSGEQPDKVNAGPGRRREPSIIGERTHAAACPAASATLADSPVDAHLSLHQKPLPDHGQSRLAPPRRYLAACDCRHCGVLERAALLASVRASRPRSSAAGRRRCSLKGKANSCASDSWSSRDIPSPNIRMRFGPRGAHLKPGRKAHTRARHFPSSRGGDHVGSNGFLLGLYPV